VSLFKYAEPTPLTVSAGKGGMPMIDVGGTARIWNNVGAHVALTRLSNASSATIEAQVPHPFYFDRLRPVSGEATNVLHRELAFHTDGAYVIPSDSILLVVFGGLSFFSVTKDFVTDLSVNESYPFDTATFAGATLTRMSANVTGFNAGADVTVMVGRQWGLGGVLRYSRATVPFKSGDIDFGTQVLGGIQAGGGLRLIF
jgi:hypothetical protein